MQRKTCYTCRKTITGKVMNVDGEDTCEACNAEMDSIINIAIHGAMREFQTGGFQDRKISSAQPVTSAPVVFKATPVTKPSYTPTATRTPAFPKPVNSSFSPAPKPSPSTPSRKYALFCPECGTKNDDDDAFCGECGTRMS